MVKIRVEDTYTNKVFETECDGCIDFNAPTQRK